MRTRRLGLVTGVVVLALGLAPPAHSVVLSEVEPTGDGATVTFFGGAQTLDAGRTAERTGETTTGLCAEGVFHSSCTPADEAAG